VDLSVQTSGISWRVYQQRDNFDDNALAFFQNFRSAPSSSALYQKGMAPVEDIVQTFAAGTLPQVA
jgi:phospholipase C